MKYLLITVALFAAIFVFSACSSPSPEPTEAPPPLLPTPEVPPVEEVDAAIEKWQNSDARDYFFEVDEKNRSEQFIIRLVVDDGEIRVAQRVDYGEDGSLGDPYTISHDEARAFMVDSLLERIRTDVLGEGDALFNMVTAFNDVLGYPLLANAEALPTYTDSGTLELNRQLSYDIITNLKPLLQDSYVSGTPIFSFTRADGPQALCDSLSILLDGSSTYTDDCRDIFWQLPTPESRLQMLNDLRSRFVQLQDTRIEDDQVEHLVIAGTGQGTPDEATIEEAWMLAAELHDLLSSPTGLGLVMAYVFDGDFFGFDVFNKITMPAQFIPSGDLNGAVLTPDGKTLAYSDADGLSVFILETLESQQLLPPPEEGYYFPRTWSHTGRLLVTHYIADERNPVKHGWISLEDAAWHDLPLPEGLSGYGCDTGVAWSPTGDQLAITGLGYGESCNINPGLTIVDLDAGTAEVVIAPQIEPLEDDGSTIVAGAHTPAWSPDGTWIAFGLDQNPDQSANFPTRLYRAHPDGGNLTPLTSNSHGFATHPVWEPDGSLYYGLSSADADLDGLYHYSPTDNIHTLLTPGTGIMPVSTSPDGEFLLYTQDQALKIWRVRLQETVAEITGDEDRHPTYSGWILVEGEQ